MNSCTEKNKAALGCELAQNLEILRDVSFFSGLSMECLKLLAYLCVREIYVPGEALFREGDDDGRFYCVIWGAVEVSLETPGGPAGLRAVGPGDFLGGISLLGPMPRLFSAKAVEDTECLVLAREKFAKAMAQFPDQMPRIFQAVASAVRAWEHRLFSGSGGPCPACMDKAGVSLL